MKLFFLLAEAAPRRGIGGHCLGSAEPQHLADSCRVGKERRKRRRETQIERATNKEWTREDEIREISERISTMIAVRRRGEADARSVRGPKERMTIAAETRELNPGRPRERERVQRRRDEEEE